MRYLIISFWLECVEERLVMCVEMKKKAERNRRGSGFISSFLGTPWNQYHSEVLKYLRNHPGPLVMLTSSGSSLAGAIDLRISFAVSRNSQTSSLLCTSDVSISQTQRLRLMARPGRDVGQLHFDIIISSSYEDQ